MPTARDALLRSLQEARESIEAIEHRILAEDVPPVEPPPNPPFDPLTESISYYWGKWGWSAPETEADKPKPTAIVENEKDVLKRTVAWCKRLKGVDVKRNSVAALPAGFGSDGTPRYMRIGENGEADLTLTPHVGQPFQRQIHVEVKRPEVRLDGKIIQRGGIQSVAQEEYQARMEARGDKYILVHSVTELVSFLTELGFTGLPKLPRKEASK